MTRRDRLGRRIGRNWWREYVCQLLRDDTDAWEQRAEAEALGYPTEIAEYKIDHPMPQLKDYLVALQGSNPVV